MAQLAPAFRDPVFESQSAFRATMDAMARPGKLTTITPRIAAPGRLCSAAAAVALALLDYETPIWLDEALHTPELADWLRFHTGVQITPDPKRAAFGFIGDAGLAPPLDYFSLGALEYPDRSTTLIVQVSSLTGGEALTLTGPGISGTQTLSASSLPSDFRARLAVNRGIFPRGIDLLLACGDEIAAIPRSARIVEKNN